MTQDVYATTSVQSEEPVTVAPKKMTRRRMVPLLIVLVAALLVWLVVLFIQGSGSSSSAVGPEIVTTTQLSEFASRAKTPIYWLGVRGNSKYELTQTSSGRVYVRYLRPGIPAGDKRANFIAVATYPEDGGVAAVSKAAENRKGARLGRTADGATLLIDPSSPDNAHLAYPGADLQIEVYSPVSGQALRLASRGDVRPVPAK
jgi:hypothetical protein